MRLLLTRTLLRLLALLPLPLNHAVGAAIGQLAYWLARRSRRIATINIAICFPELELEQQQRLLHRSFIETGKSISELGPLLHWSAARLLKKVHKIDNEQLMHDALAQGRGILLITPHLGCWEMTGLYYASLHPVTCLYRPPRMQGLEKLLIHAREKTGATLVPTNNRGVKALFRALADGQTIGILPDQDPGSESGVFAPFFGQMTHTLKLIPRLVQKTSAPLLAIYAERLPRGRGYHIHYRQAESGIDSNDLETAATALNRTIEACIRTIPAQYQWTYKRFRTPAPGQASPYQGNPPGTQ